MGCQIHQADKFHACRRFAEKSTQRQMSKWLEKNMVHHANFGTASSSLTRFFKVGGDGDGGDGGGERKDVSHLVCNIVLCP
eukprot:1160535-Pelagomonas_calceolata.AAC.9